MSKNLLRQKFLNIKADVEYDKASNIISKNLEHLILSIANKRDIIGLYWPLEHEPDIAKLIISLGMRIAIPKISVVSRKSYEMKFVFYTLGSRIENSPIKNLMQPVIEDGCVPDIIVVPGLSFSLDGQRLGFGSGCYDQYLARCHNSVRIGACYHHRLIERLPFYNESDVVMNYVVTQKMTIKI